jgi:putative two-component system response regulator
MVERGESLSIDEEPSDAEDGYIVLGEADAKELQDEIDAKIRGSRILIIDDEVHHVEQLVNLLAAEGFQNVSTTLDPQEGLALVFADEPDIVLLDLHMPELSGVDFMRHVRSDPSRFPFLPILILTDDTSHETRRHALANGANDILVKPFDAVEVLLRVQNLLEIKRLNQQIERHSEELEVLVGIRTAELEHTRLEVLERLAIAAEFRDDDTRDHTRRVGHSAALIAQAMGFTPFEVDTIRRASPLHDLGKIGIPDSVLLKPGRLTEEEFAIMKSHAKIGAEILEGSEYHLLEVAKEIAIAHHERFDGTGYPNGLKGEQIPAVARIVSVCDVFDALTHERCYKPAWPVEDAVAEITKCRGTQFDPEVVDVFVHLYEQRRLVV